MCGGDGCGDDGDGWSGGSGGLRREAHESACRPCFVECEAGAVFLCGGAMCVCVSLSWFLGADA